MVWKEFYKYWSAYVYRLTEQDGIDVWNDWLTSVTNDELLKASIEEVGTNLGKFSKRPHLGDLKKVYYRKLKSYESVNGCRYCGGYSFVVVFQIVNGKRSLVRNPKHSGGKCPDGRGEFGVYQTSCVCRPENRSSWEKFGYCVFGLAHDPDAWRSAKAFVKKLQKSYKSEQIYKK